LSYTITAYLICQSEIINDEKAYSKEGRSPEVILLASSRSDSVGNAGNICDTKEANSTYRVRISGHPVNPV